MGSAAKEHAKAYKLTKAKLSEANLKAAIKAGEVPADTRMDGETSVAEVAAASSSSSPTPTIVKKRRAIAASAEDDASESPAPPAKKKVRKIVVTTKALAEDDDTDEQVPAVAPVKKAVSTKARARPGMNRVAKLKSLSNPSTRLNGQHLNIKNLPMRAFIKSILHDRVNPAFVNQKGIRVMETAAVQIHQVLETYARDFLLGAKQVAYADKGRRTVKVSDVRIAVALMNAGH